jgi:hypothetical protein
MKKLIIMMTLILMTVFLSGGSAWAGGHGHFGIFIGPPPIRIGPPVIIHRGYYPPPYYYPPNDYAPYRVWIPGHWEERWGAYGWEKVWIPGYWRYNP